jgi:hypothetical protein
VPAAIPSGPSGNIGPKEVIGRRVFGDTIWNDDFGQGRKRVYRLDHFWDKRSSDGFSVDRLGATGIALKVARYLSSIAREECSRRAPPISFAGWATCQAERIQNPPVSFHIRPDPIEEASPVQANPFHALISSDRVDFKDYVFAASLRAVFEEHGRFEAAIQPPTHSSGSGNPDTRTATETPNE